MLCKSTLFSIFLRQSSTKNLQQKCAAGLRFLSHYPIDDQLFGLNEEQRQVFIPFAIFKFIIQLRETASKIAQKELAPYAHSIDQMNGWDRLREFWTILGQNGLLGITVPTEYGGSDYGYMEHVIVMEVIFL